MLCIPSNIMGWEYYTVSFSTAYRCFFSWTWASEEYLAKNTKGCDVIVATSSVPCVMGWEHDTVSFSIVWLSFFPICIWLCKMQFIFVPSKRLICTFFTPCIQPNGLKTFVNFYMPFNITSWNDIDSMWDLHRILTLPLESLRFLYSGLSTLCKEDQL